MLLIGTPAYNGFVHTDYVHSLIDMYKCGVNFSLMTLSNESLITRARNTIISVFKNNPMFTHLLFLDGDIFLPGSAIAQLFNYQKDVIGVPVPLKGFDKINNPVFNVGEMIEDCGNGLFETTKVGTAVLMLSRKAVEALCKTAPTYDPNPHTRGMTINSTMYDVFQVGVQDGIYQSEDYWACFKLRELGFKVYIDSTIPVKHNGMFTFCS